MPKCQLPYFALHKGLLGQKKLLVITAYPMLKTRHHEKYRKSCFLIKGYEKIC